mmetsp:Transcript_16660/g.58075  ORF Transcript_16660/g.58075 Transcript_16660/m.58075 type:complete len:307 (-) Transcript_16660:962-1882(-)
MATASGQTADVGAVSRLIATHDGAAEAFSKKLADDRARKRQALLAKLQSRAANTGERRVLEVDQVEKALKELDAAVEADRIVQLRAFIQEQRRIALEALERAALQELAAKSRYAQERRLELRGLFVALRDDETWAAERRRQASDDRAKKQRGAIERRLAQRRKASNAPATLRASEARRSEAERPSILVSTPQAPDSPLQPPDSPPVPKAGGLAAQIFEARERQAVSRQLNAKRQERLLPPAQGNQGGKGYSSRGQPPSVGGSLPTSMGGSLPGPRLFERPPAAQKFSAAPEGASMRRPVHWHAQAK